MSRVTKRNSKKINPRVSAALTPRQLEILRLIDAYRNSNGCSPTLAEIAGSLGVSKVTVFEHVGVLESKGLLLREPNKARSLIINHDLCGDLLGDFEGNRGDGSIDGRGQYKLAGCIAAGVPLEAIEQADELDLTTMFESSGGTYALEVRGDSMIDEHICPGDYVLVESCENARDGQVVVALLPDGQATLKKFYREGRGFRLEAANASYSPIYTGEVDIRGVVIGVLRRF